MAIMPVSFVLVYCLLRAYAYVCILFAYCLYIASFKPLVLRTIE